MEKVKIAFIIFAAVVMGLVIYDTSKNPPQETTVVEDIITVKCTAKEKDVNIVSNGKVTVPIYSYKVYFSYDGESHFITSSELYESIQEGDSFKILKRSYIKGEDLIKTEFKLY